jgi:hypothetical protein
MASTTPTRPPNFSNSSVRDGSPDPSSIASVAQGNGDHPGAPRRSSFNFLRKKSSSETRSTSRSASGKMSKKQKALAQEEARQQREAAMLPKQPPRLPSHSALPQMATFGGEDHRPDSVAIVSNRAGNYSNFSRPSVDYTPPKASMAAHPNSLAAAAAAPPPPPGSSPSYIDFDPYPRSESMTNRGRYSYASSQISTVNSPRRVRRRKDPTPFK